MNEPSRAEAVFLAAIEKPTPQDREAYVEGACAGDAALRRKVHELLQAHDQSQGPLDAPPIELGATGDLSPLEPRLGAQIGPYKLREQIGEGGFGVVYVAEQEHPVRRKVALKIIKPGMDTKDVIARFEAERQALAVMDHPNVARVLDAGATSAGRPFFVMELVHGVPITEFCDKNHLTARQRLELFVDVCRAVQHAHQKGIIHRDLKPNNILVTLHDGRPVPKVIDFGVSKALSQQLTEKTIYTRYGQMIGTPIYMSPEQAEMSGLGIDTRSDIYSLGVLLYELLTGKTPLDELRLRSSGYAEMLRIIREEEPPRPSLRISGLGDESTSIAALRSTDAKKLGQSLRGELDWIVMKALDKNRERRYETANQFAADVEHYLHEEPVQACPPSTAYRFRKFARRNKRLIATALAIASALVLATMVSVSYAMVARTALASERQARVEQEILRKVVETERNRARRSAQLAQARLKQVEAEKERVEQERAVAQAVHDYLQNDLTGGQDLAVRRRSEHGIVAGMNFPELLDRAARGLEDRFPNQPLSEAAVRLALGQNYRMIRNYEKARQHIQRSVKLRTEILGPDDPSTLDSKWLLAGLLHDEGKYALAQPLLIEVLEAYAAKKGASDPQTINCQNSLALLHHDQKQHEQAEALYRAALAQAQISVSGDDELALVLTSNLAALCQDQQRYDEAQALYEQVLTSRVARLGPDDHRTRLIAQGLAAVYRSQGNSTAADELFEQLPKARASSLFRGPINVTLAGRDPVILIAPTNESGPEIQKMIASHVQFMKEHLQKNKEVPTTLMTDNEALEADLADSVLLVYGTPTGNLWLAKHVPQLADRFATARRLAVKSGQQEEKLRFITAWPHPDSENLGMTIYTATHADQIPNINAVFHGPYDFVLTRGEYELRSGNYLKDDGEWTLPAPSSPATPPEKQE